MGKRVTAIVLSCLAATAIVRGADAPAAPIFSPMTSPGISYQSTVQEMRLNFYVASRNGRAAGGLQKNQFVVYEDDQAVPEITGFYADQDLPLQLTVMIDYSDSMTKELTAQQDVANAFLRHLIRPALDQGSVVAFSTHAWLDQVADASSPEALRSIAMRQPSGLTALFDSICEVAAAMHTSGKQRSGLNHHVLVLFSDGDDTYSMHSMDDAIAAAQSSDVVIYAVSVPHRKNTGWGDANLEKITAATGGRALFIENYDSSESVFADLAQEMRAQYAVTFRLAENTCGFHSVRVGTTDRSLQVRSRRGFYRDCP